MFLAISSGAVSALAVAFSTYLGAVIPQSGRLGLGPDIPGPRRFLWGSAFALVVNVIIATPWDAAKGLGIVLMGCPVYWFLFQHDAQAGTS